MKTFDELINEEDRASIKSSIRDSMCDQIEIKNNVIEPFVL